MVYGGSLLIKTETGSRNNQPVATTASAAERDIYTKFHVRVENWVPEAPSGQNAFFRPNSRRRKSAV